MVQTVLEQFWLVFVAWGPLWRALAWGLGLGGAALLVVRLTGRAIFDRVWGRGSGLLRAWGGWAAAALVLALCWSALDTLGPLVQSRARLSDGSGSVRSADPDAAPTTQQAPRATYLSQKTYARSLVLPAAFLKRAQAGDVGAFAPYLGDPESGNVLALRDRFSRRGQDVVLTRTATLRTEEPLRLDRSRMTLHLDFVSPLRGARRTYYNAQFGGEYALTNPLPTPIQARFVFPLPRGSGTLSDFGLVVDGRELTASDLSGSDLGAEAEGRGWQGTLQPGQTVTVQVHYRHQGARGWSYVLGQRRDEVRDFALRVQTNQPARFARYSLYPTRSARTLGGSELNWELKNVITAQDIALTFTSASLHETLGKMYAFMPLSLLLAALFGGVWAGLRGLRAAPLPVALAGLSVLAGAALCGVLLSYLPLPLAALASALVAGGLALRSLGRAWAVPVALAVGLPLVFLVGGHAGLLLALLGVGLLAVVIGGIGRMDGGRTNPPGTPRPPAQTVHLAPRPAVGGVAGPDRA